MVFDGSPSCTMIRWCCSKKGLQLSKKSRVLIMGITMSSSSFKGGVTLVEGSAIGNRQIERESCRGFERHTVRLDEESKTLSMRVCVCTHTLDLSQVQ